MDLCKFDKNFNNKYNSLLMCVDDYPFRDPSALREKICRRFIFENDEGYRRVFNINISQFERNGDLCLC